MSVATPALPPIWTRIDEHLDCYDVIFSDIWGVLHNGKTAWPLASEALTRYRGRGGKVVLVSNAPRPGVLVPELLAHWGVLPTAWDEIVTSGDVTRQLIVERGTTPFLHIGPERDLPLLGEQAALRVPLEEAGYIRGYHADINPRELGFEVQVFAMVRLHSQAEVDLSAFEQRCREWPLVRECHMLNGEIDFILKCVAPDLSTFQTFLTEGLTSAANVASVKTSLVIRCAKDEPGVPFEVLEERLARNA